MEKRKGAILVLILIALATITGLAVSNVYAKFKATVLATATVEIADWKFDEDNSTQTVTVNLADTVNSDTLSNGKIAPGASGTFDVKVSNKNTDVAVDYVVKVGTIEGLPKGLTITNPVNASGTLAPNAEEQIITFTWTWTYNGDDDDDMASAGASLTIPLTIEGTQVDPTK